MNTAQTLAQQDDFRTKRQHILDAAYLIFSRKGYHRTTIDEIIAMADTGKGTVYNYFVNKEHLFYTLTHEVSQPFEADLAKVISSGTEPLTKVRQLIMLFLAFYSQHGDLWRVLMHEMRGFGTDGYSHLSDEIREKYNDFFQRTIGTLGQAFKEGIAAGVIRQCDPIVTAHGAFSVIVMMAFQHFISDGIEQTAATITDMLLFGIARQSAAQ